MGYKNFQVVKDVYIPISYEDDLTLAQYQEKYGIDLNNIVSLSDNEIMLNLPPFIKFYIVLCQPDTGLSIGGGRKVVTDLEVSNTNQYDSGVSDAITSFGSYSFVEESIYGILFSIDKDDDFTMENVHIKAYLL